MAGTYKNKGAGWQKENGFSLQTSNKVNAVFKDPFLNVSHSENSDGLTICSILGGSI